MNFEQINDQCQDDIEQKNNIGTTVHCYYNALNTYFK